ncbi:unnamed protein product [Ectocarpus sp. 12 AP-2014]
MPSNTLTPRSGACPGFWQIAFSTPVAKRATRIALIVGTIIAAINHGDRMLLANIDLATVFKIMLTYCVPYSVSTYSSVLAIRETYAAQRAVLQDQQPN